MKALAIVNGRVFTSRPGDPAFSGGVTAIDGRIVAVGPDEAVRAALPPDGEIVDARGGSVVPGFVDAHNHLAFTGAELAAVDVRSPGRLVDRGPRGADRRGRRTHTRRANGSARSG